MKKVLFIDRDGTILIEPPDKQVDSIDKLAFVPGVITALHRIVSELNYELVMVSNQDGLGTDAFPEADFSAPHNLMLKILAGEGIVFDDILIDKSRPAAQAPTRKPRTGLLANYLKDDYDLPNSFVIGDRVTDVQLARNIGARAIYLGKDQDIKAELVTENWNRIYEFLLSRDRTVRVERQTCETAIRMQLCLDGTGNVQIETGIGFFDHMLNLLAQHAGCDVELIAKGDLNADEHHTIEDVALVWGEALRQALGNKKGIERYGFLLPMDESLARVALDLSGRSNLVWKCEFKREYIGQVPTEMFSHFFKSFTDAARCTLHITAMGKNEHHKIEAIFKAVGRAIRTAVRRESGRSQVPSTKGVL